MALSDLGYGYYTRTIVTSPIGERVKRRYQECEVCSLARSEALEAEPGAIRSRLGQYMGTGAWRTELGSSVVVRVSRDCGPLAVAPSTRSNGSQPFLYCPYLSLFWIFTVHIPHLNKSTVFILYGCQNQLL